MTVVNIMMFSLASHCSMDTRFRGYDSERFPVDTHSCSYFLFPISYVPPRNARMFARA